MQNIRKWADISKRCNQNGMAGGFQLTAVCTEFSHDVVCVWCVQNGKVFPVHINRAARKFKNAALYFSCHSVLCMCILRSKKLFLANLMQMWPKMTLNAYNELQSSNFHHTHVFNTSSVDTSWHEVTSMAIPPTTTFTIVEKVETTQSV